MAKVFKSIDAAIFNLDDPRVAYLESGEEEKFYNLIAKNDPFMVRGGNLVFISPEEAIKHRENFVRAQKETIIAYGNISMLDFFDKRADVIRVFPELTNDFRNIETKAETANCKQCEIRRLTAPIIKKMFGIPLNNRDLSSLICFGEFAMNKFQGLKLIVTDDMLNIPDEFNKIQIPFKKHIADNSNKDTVTLPAKIKSTNRKQISEILLAAANVELASRYIAETVAINRSKMKDSELIAASESCNRLGSISQNLMHKVIEQVPEASGWLCVMKHAPVAESQMYTLYQETGDICYAKLAEQLKIIVDDLLNIDSSINFDN